MQFFKYCKSVCGVARVSSQTWGDQTESSLPPYFSLKRTTVKVQRLTIFYVEQAWLTCFVFLCVHASYFTYSFAIELANKSYFSER